MPVRAAAIAALIPVLRAVRLAPFVRRLSPAEVERAVEAAGFRIVERGDYPRTPARRFIVAERV